MMNTFNSCLETLRNADFGYLSEDAFLLMGAVALGLLLFLLFLRLRPPSRIRAFRGETGYVEISRHALLGLVYSACEQLPEVRKPSVKVRGRGKLNLSVRIRVDGSAHLRDTASYLQTHLKDALENNLGVEKLGKIEILVTGIRVGSLRKVDLNQTPADEKVSPKSSPPAPGEKEIPAKEPIPPAVTAPKPDLSPRKNSPSEPNVSKPTSTVPVKPTNSDASSKENSGTKGI